MTRYLLLCVSPQLAQMRSAHPIPMPRQSQNLAQWPVMSARESYLPAEGQIDSTDRKMALASIWQVDAEWSTRQRAVNYLVICRGGQGVEGPTARTPLEKSEPFVQATEPGLGSILGLQETPSALSHSRCRAR
jgi:hypothetical protein